MRLAVPTKNPLKREEIRKIKEDFKARNLFLTEHLGTLGCRWFTIDFVWVTFVRCGEEWEGDKCTCVLNMNGG